MISALQVKALLVILAWATSREAYIPREGASASTDAPPIIAGRFLDHTYFPTGEVLSSRRLEGDLKIVEILGVLGRDAPASQRSARSHGVGVVYSVDCAQKTYSVMSNRISRYDGTLSTSYPGPERVFQFSGPVGSMLERICPRWAVDYDQEEVDFTSIRQFIDQAASIPVEPRPAHPGPEAVQAG